MKINTDGTLLGALSHAQTPKRILDIGAGTGVVALMLAQRYSEAKIDAVEIEEHAAITARENFHNSPFSDRLELHAEAFQEFSCNYPERKYDLIVSNPPFFLDSLKNPDKKKQTARHTTDLFFQELINFAAKHLQPSGTFSLILPPQAAQLCMDLSKKSKLFSKEIVNIRSFKHSDVHRQLISLQYSNSSCETYDFVIYALQKEYSSQFVNALRDFFTIF